MAKQDSNLWVDLCVMTAWLESKGEMKKKARMFIDHLTLKYMRILSKPILTFEDPVNGISTFAIEVPREQSLQVVEALSLLEDKFNFLQFIEFKGIKARMEMGALHESILELSNSIVREIFMLKAKTK